MSGNKRVILHIGAMKTGTTSLQAHLQNNSDVLSEQGIGYYSQRYLSYTTWANAGFLCGLSLFDARGKGEQNSNFTKESKDFAEYAKDYGTLILSDEFLWEKGVEAPDFWKAVKSNIRRLLGENTQIDIILFLRRQDEWALSMWKERLLNWNQSEQADFLDYVKLMRESGRFDYDVSLEKLSEIFGREHVTVCGYYGENSAGPDTTMAFLEAAGIDMTSFKKRDDVFSNRSVSMRTAKAMLVINRRDDYKDEGSRRKITYAARTFSSMFPDEEHYYPMNKEERRAFLSEFDNINRRVSLEYNSGDDFFEKEIPEYSVWKDDPEQAATDADLVIKLASGSDETLSLLNQYT